jgi:hypothetical protein
MPIQGPTSPLDRIPGLEEVPPEQVKALEDRLRPGSEKVRRQMVEDQEQANKIRKVPLY